MAEDLPTSGTAQPDVDVLVVGAGPTGLALAAQLTRYGTNVRIVDRLLDRVRESRALAVQPRTLEVLDPFGVTDELVERGNRAVRALLHVGGRVIPVGLFDIGIEDTAYPYLLFVSQAETERVLGDYLTGCGATVQREVELVRLVQANRSVTCLLRRSHGSEEVISARYVVGCDGAHSTVREQAGIAFEGSAYPQTFVLADVEADGIELGSVHAFIAERGILFFFPLGEPATWRMLTMRPGPMEAAVGVTLDELQALADAYATTPVQLHDPVWMTNFRLYNRGAAQYRSGRVFLAGDAAHIHSPAGAQGMNTGIQDAVNLGWKLALVAEGNADPRLLDSYESERAPVGRMVLRFTDRVFTVGTSRNPVIRFARSQVMPRLAPLVLRGKAGRRIVFRTVSQLGIRYRDSPLSAEGPGAPARGPRSGDRLSDAPVAVDGQDRTLHRSLASPGFHVLLCGPSAAWATESSAGVVDGSSISVHRLTRAADRPGDLVDLTGLASNRLGVIGDDAVHYLIRPDGHVAYRAGSDLTGLRAYLAGWGVTPA
jgi:2-polyprenyl-6-methoxyphenol hydroxylase-like FAD-dependent oxidoreductase